MGCFGERGTPAMRWWIAVAAAVAAGLAFVAEGRAERLCQGDFCKPVARPLESGEGACFHVAASYGGYSKEEAVDKTQRALLETIRTWRRRQGWGREPVSVDPMRPEPRPFVRGSVSEDLMLPPDVVSDMAHTTCWKGLVLPAVCSAGARVCRTRR